MTGLPDITRKSESERVRSGALGGAEYERLYAGLTQQYFDCKQMAGLAEASGLRVKLTTQEISGQGNSPYRFNISFEKP